MSTYGTLLKVTSYGESHGKAIGCVIDGFLPNIEINFDLIQKQLDRRRPNQSKLTTNRNEKDKLVILSGFDENKTLGTPITFLIYNEDIKKEHYNSFINIPRPGHGDYTYFMKYHVKNKSGSSRFSGRETATRVAAGACIEQWLYKFYNCSIVSYVHSVGNIKIPEQVSKELENENPPSRDMVDYYGTVRYNEKEKIFMDCFNRLYDIDGSIIETDEYKKNILTIPSMDNTYINVSLNKCNIKQVDNNNNINDNDKEYINSEKNDEWIYLQTRCPHPYTAIQMCSYILKLKNKGDSVGGIATCIIQNPPIGIGEPIFDKMEAELAKMILSIPAVKGIEFGSGFNGTYMFGSDHNDIFLPVDKMSTKKESHEDENQNMSYYPPNKNKHDQILNSTKEYMCTKNNKNFNNIHNNITSNNNEEKLLVTKTNNCGGVLAGITTGNNIVFRSAIKPVSSIQIEKETSDFYGNICSLKVQGRHDCCILPRLPAVIEASSSIVIGDLILRQIAKYGDKNLPSLARNM
ncbi:chorismate synthase [Plasmodium gaboni]|uniref:chorismate synthase n=1 Tax=Plasmodium gaboni TaxID=647221 RepID=A0A151LRY1_9APIC|nr:chorismate synthase [Plasmodium gaboni]KYO01922.1 chorismate synthase [Plasmodium gaboni]